LKVSSISGNGLETNFIPAHQSNSLFDTVQSQVTTLMKTISRIGSAIAIAEKGDLEGAHKLRTEGNGSR